MNISKNICDNSKKEIDRRLENLECSISNINKKFSMYVKNLYFFWVVGGLVSIFFTLMGLFYAELRNISADVHETKIDIMEIKTTLNLNNFPRKQ